MFQADFLKIQSPDYRGFVSYLPNSTSDIDETCPNVVGYGFPCYQGGH